MEAANKPNAETTQAARNAADLLTAAGPDRTAELRLKGEPCVSVTLPAEAVPLLIEVLSYLAEGNGVTVLPVETELTTQQAADLLNVSRPYLIKLLDSRKLPSRKVGKHRRVRLNDVLIYKQIDDASRTEAADRLSAEAQALGLGY